MTFFRSFVSRVLTQFLIRPTGMDVVLLRQPCVRDFVGTHSLLGDPWCSSLMPFLVLRCIILCRGCKLPVADVSVFILRNFALH